MTADPFVVCSVCRHPIAYGAEYYRCSVSTCNRAKLALYFCTLPCFSAHVPDAKHRDAWAESVTAPLQPELGNERSHSAVSSPLAAPPRRMVVAATPSAPEPAASSERDVLIVVSKLKAYIKTQSGMNTSDSVIDCLSQKVRELCNEAIRNAARDGRKTVLDRDFLGARKATSMGPDNNLLSGVARIEETSRSSSASSNFTPQSSTSQAPSNGVRIRSKTFLAMKPARYSPHPGGRDISPACGEREAPPHVDT